MVDRKEVLIFWIHSSSDSIRKKKLIGYLQELNYFFFQILSKKHTCCVPDSTSLSTKYER